MNYQTNHTLDLNIDQIRHQLLDDLYFFFFYMFSRVNGVIPQIPTPDCRENHFRIACNKLMQAMRCDVDALPSLVLGLYFAPRYGKTTMCIYTMAWVYAHNPRANFIYASYKKMLSAEKTEEVRNILQSRTFQSFFDTRISKSSSAKDNFSTVQGGRTIAVGADGSGLGSGAGTTDKESYGGAIFMDDMIKAQDAHSAAMINSVKKLYSQTLVNRRNDPSTTPIINIAQRISQNDLAAMLEDGKDDNALDIYSKDWKANAVKIAALDSNNHALWPEKHSSDYLISLRENDPYTFYAQMQQEPISDSTRIFAVNRIQMFKEDPEIIATFITADTAETADKVNDASVFSFFGVYECAFNGQKTGVLGLHWISCYEVRVEPQDLVDEFEAFYSSCLRYKKKPERIYIEKKSTGSMLLGFIKDRQGIISIDISRNSVNRKDALSVLTFGSKVERFKRTAPYLAKGQLSMTEGCDHKKRCIDQLKSITISMTQNHDDIADTLSDAITIALDDKLIYNNSTVNSVPDVVSKISLINKRLRS